jgi:hypothetical protein
MILLKRVFYIGQDAELNVSSRENFVIDWQDKIVKRVTNARQLANQFNVSFVKIGETGIFDEDDVARPARNLSRLV